MNCKGKLAAQVVLLLTQESVLEFWHCAENPDKSALEHINSVLASVKAKLPA
jgi:hypothetical protein